MTINSTSRTAGPFTGNGVTTVFPFAFKVFARADVLVAITNTTTFVETVLLLDSDYTVTLNADQNSSPGGTITMLVPPPVGTTLAATSNVPYLQKTDLTNQGGFYPKVITDALDKLTIHVQQLASKLGAGLNVGGAAAFAVIMNFIANMTGSAGATLIGYLDAGANAVVTTIAEVFSRRVNVWDFMTPTQRLDALSGAPVLDHAPAFNAAILSLGGIGRVEVPRKRTAAYLFKSTVNLGTSNAVDSRVGLDIEYGTPIYTTLPNALDAAISLKNVPGHYNNQRIRNLRLISTNGNGVGVKFNGQCFGGLDDFYIEGFQIGLFYSNAGVGIFNEFIRANRGELHLNGVNAQLDKDGGDQVSMHGLTFRDVTMNTGSGCYGLNIVNVAWYNADFNFRMFAADGHAAVIRMDCNSTTTGVYGVGTISCEGPPSGPAIITGIGRMSFHGTVNFMSGLTDNLTSPNASEPSGLVCSNYFKPQAYGSSAYTVNELRSKAPNSMSAGNGPYGSFGRLTASNVESLISVSYAAHGSVAGNGFYTGYTSGAYSAAALGCFLSSDGTEIASKAPLATQCAIKHNAQYIIRFDGSVKANSLEGFLIGSGGTAIYSGTGSPEGVVTASVSSRYARRDGGTATSLYVKETGSGNTGWIAK